MGDADYMLAFQNIVMPIAHEFDPDLVISRFRYEKTSSHPLIVNGSLGRVRCSSRRHARRLLRYTRLLRSFDAYAHVPG